jgi:hypothetical protein
VDDGIGVVADVAVDDTAEEPEAIVGGLIEPVR